MCKAKEGKVLMETNVILYGLAGLLFIGVIIAIIKKVAKFILIIGIFGIIALSLMGAGLSTKSIKDMNINDWKEVTQNQYNKYKDEIENNPEIQAVYNKMVETASGAVDNAKEKAMIELMKQLETLSEKDYQLNKDVTETDSEVSE